MSKAAIIQYDGRQFRCMEGDILTVNRLPNEVGDSIQIESVIGYIDGDTIETDSKKLKNTTVTVTVEENGRLPKVVTRKYRRRKSSRSQYAHRQPITKLKVTNITAT